MGTESLNGQLHECAQAFSTLKHCFAHTPVLAFPDFTKTCTLDTDASNQALRLYSHKMWMAKNELL